MPQFAFAEALQAVYDGICRIDGYVAMRGLRPRTPRRRTRKKAVVNRFYFLFMLINLFRLYFISVILS